MGGRVEGRKNVYSSITDLESLGPASVQSLPTDNGKVFVTVKHVRKKSYMMKFFFTFFLTRSSPSCRRLCNEEEKEEEEEEKKLYLPIFSIRKKIPFTVLSKCKQIGDICLHQ